MARSTEEKPGQRGGLGLVLRARRLFPVILGHTFTNAIGGLTFLFAG